MHPEQDAQAPPGYDRVLTLPNLLSMLRLVGVPVFLVLVLLGHDTWAFVTLAVAGLTDYLDGRIARLLGQVTRVGEMLDPVADRLYILAALVGLVARGFVPWWIAALVVARDLWGVLELARLRRYGVTRLPVIFIGKAATFALLYAFPLLLLAHGTSTTAAVVRPLAWAFTWWGIGLYWLSAAVYYDQARSIVRRSRQVSA